MTCRDQQKRPSVALFGPEITDWTEDSLESLQTALQEDPNLEFLSQSVAQLPTLWPTLHHHDSSLHLPADVLRQLSDFAAGKPTLDPARLSNVHLAPLTLISHVADFVRRAEEEQRATAINGSRTEMRLPSFDAAQGFCVGFLTAAAVGSAYDWPSFEMNASRALLLAVCVGAVIDREDQRHEAEQRATAISARWKSDSDRTFLEATLDAFPSAYVSCITDEKTVTITLPKSDEDRFCARLTSGARITTGHNDLNGCFHHSRHGSAAGALKELCAAAPELQLPPAAQLHLPLRSTVDAAIIAEGQLHDAALDAILCRRAHWYQTVKATLDALSPDGGVDIIAFGKKESLIPRTLALRNRGIRGSSTAEDETSSRPEEIAVVGMACRFPEADSVEEFWDLITSGRTAISTIPHERFNPSEITREPRLPNFWGNFLRNPDTFDHRFFNVSGREAKSMDPQQRLALQVAYEALESSGYYSLPEERQASDIGCYLGIGTVDYEHNVASETANAFSATGTLRAFASGRISHFFGWTGPSITFDTACSSSAVAIHTACKALLAKECSVALAGGVNVMTSPNLYQNLSAASFLDPSGPSKAFDEAANGYSRGEGAGLLVLKPLSKAKADGDFILGVIAGSAINQGSNCSPLTQSDPVSQNSLYKQVLSVAEIEAKDVTYVEAHGTGTLVGDPIEYESVRATFTGLNRSEKLFLGAVKDNIGHAEAASGTAGIIKCILMMQYEMIPKQANFVKLNPRIKASNEIIIPTENVPWTAKQRVALINNYGASGSIATIVVREPGSDAKLASPDGSRTTNERLLGSYPILLAAKSQNSLQEYMSALKSHAATSKEHFGSLAYNIARQQNPAFEFRASITASNTETLISALEATPPIVKVPAKRPVVLCFGGQNGDIVALSKDLFNSSSLLQKYLSECDAACRELGLPSILPGIFESTAVDDLVSVHCRLFSLQYSSAKCWISSGLEVDTLIGHSFGQLTALCVSDALSLTDALRLISGRARLMRDSWGEERGVMLSVEGDRKDVESLVTSVNSQGSRVDFACYNGPRSFVLAGDSASVAKLEASCQATSSPSRIKTTKLKNSRAYHSYLADGILAELEVVARSIHLKKPRINIETCTPNGVSWQFTVDEIVQHTRQPVCFSDAVQRISTRIPSATWLEAGSASPIIPMTRRILAAHLSSDHVFIPNDLSTIEATKNLSSAVCQLWMAGSKARYWPFHRLQKDSYENINIPPYQFEKAKHWIKYRPRVEVPKPSGPEPEPRRGSLVNLVKNESGHALFSVDTNHAIFSLSARGHAVAGQSLCPASMYVELAARCAVLVLPAVGSGRVPQIEDLRMSAPLGLSTDVGVFVHLVQDTPDGAFSFAIVSRPGTGNGETEHARGRLNATRADDPVAASRLKLLKRLARPSRCDQIVASPIATGLTGSMVYKVFKDVVEYAPYYHGVKSLSGLENEAVGLVTVPNDRGFGLEAGICDPISLDNFLQVAGIHVNCLSDRKGEEVFMCTAIEEVLFSASFMENRADSRNWTVYTRYDVASRNTVANDIFVFDGNSKELVMSVMGATFRSVPFKAVARSLSRLNGVPNPRGVTSSPQYSNSNSSSEQEQEDPGYHSLTPRTPVDDDFDPFNIKSFPETRKALPNTLAVPENSTVNAAEKSDHLAQKLRELLSEIIEIPVSEVPATAKFDDLGIDSLLVTEVLTEIQKRLHVTITPAAFQKCDDIPSLCRLIHPESSPETISVPRGTAVEHKNLFSREKAVPAADLTPQQGNTSANFALVSHECFSTVRDTYDEHAATTGFTNFRTEVFPLQSQLVVQYVVEAFASLGLDLKAVQAGSEIPTIPYTPKHVKLVEQMYRILEEGGLINQENGVYRRTAKAISNVPSFTLHATMLARFPQHTAETKLLHSTAHQLAECLSGTADPIGILFGSAPARALLEDMYTNAPMFKAGTLLLGDYLSSVLSRFASTGRPVHILELGAGTGGTTKKLLETLTASPNGSNFTYTFTDLSSSLVVAAKRKFAKYPFMRYSVLDVETEPESQFLGQFDVIISTNCIHATRDLVNSTRHIRQMLHPDGILCLVEATRNLFWFDLVFGLLEGWWLATDGRQHPLADEHRWEHDLRNAGFRWVEWSDCPSAESDVLRVITASPFEVVPAVVLSGSNSNGPSVTQETVSYKTVDGLQLEADIHYPPETVQAGQSFSVALMIHGGGHVMLSRHDVRPEQTKILLQSGFLPISIDYRLCPETTLSEGPMTDVADALAWVKNKLPHISRKRPDVRISVEKVVVVGWSTGGMLAMSLAWTSAQKGVPGPDAILSFYCPTDYEDQFWTTSNIPDGSEDMAAALSHGKLDDEIWTGISDRPLPGYTVPTAKRAYGVTGGLSMSDPRTRLALYMNWRGKTLDVLLNGLNKAAREEPLSATPAQISAVSPLAQIRKGAYATPTFIIHPRKDDLIPYSQSERTIDALSAAGVDAELRIVEDVPHLFDVYRGWDKNEDAKKAVLDGYAFLSRHI